MADTDDKNNETNNTDLMRDMEDRDLESLQKDLSDSE
jgi:hypothetical protein